MSHPNTNTNVLHTTMQLLFENQRQLWKLINDHLPKIDQNHSEFEEDLMTKPKACKTCGEIGHTSKECSDEWPHGHTRHLVKGCPQVRLLASCVKEQIMSQYSVNFIPWCNKLSSKPSKECNSLS